MSDETPPAGPLRALDDPPGGVLLWLIVALELLTFAMLFVYLAELRVTQQAVFAAGQQELSVAFGFALTGVLITSGALAAYAVHLYRATRLAEARRYFLGAAGVGAVFVGLKMVDYAVHAQAGRGLGRSDFWDAYFLSTGFHLLHVVVGLGLLVGVASRVGRVKFTDEETAVVGSALFWHLCDVVWFFLFPLFFAGA